MLGTFFAALHSHASATEGMSYTDINRMETPSVGASTSTGRPEDQQFARFLEAANRLGENLDTVFASEFLKDSCQPFVDPSSCSTTSQPYG